MATRPHPNLCPALSVSNCYHLCPLFCFFSASVRPNHVSIQKPKCHLCVWLQLQYQSFGEQPIKPMRERESFVNSLWFFYCSFMRFFLLMAHWASHSLCVCVQSWQHRALKYSIWEKMAESHRYFMARRRSLRFWVIFRCRADLENMKNLNDLGQLH